MTLAGVSVLKTVEKACSKHTVALDESIICRDLGMLANCECDVEEL